MERERIMHKKHLPVYGVGPLCGISMLLLLIVGVLLLHFGYLESGKIEALRIPFIALGILWIVLAIWIWIQAVLVSRIHQAILDNQLVKTGVYAWVRNPIYTAIAMALTGIVFLIANFWLLILPVLFWLDITILMKTTEEKWMTARYGQVYLDYCKQVHRCIPWPPSTNSRSSRIL